MRTDKQIENLREVLAKMIGSFAYVLSAEMIDTWAATLQNNINGIHTWEIRIALHEDRSKSWNIIEPEPKKPTCSPEVIFEKCDQLMGRYPDIWAIQITIVGETIERSFEVNRSMLGL